MIGCVRTFFLPPRYPMNGELIESLANVVAEKFTDLNNALYTATALEAIHLIYRVSFLRIRFL